MQKHPIYYECLVAPWGHHRGTYSSHRMVCEYCHQPIFRDLDGALYQEMFWILEEPDPFD